MTNGYETTFPVAASSTNTKDLNNYRVDPYAATFQPYGSIARAVILCRP